MWHTGCGTSRSGLWFKFWGLKLSHLETSSKQEYTKILDKLGWARPHLRSTIGYSFEALLQNELIYNPFARWVVAGWSSKILMPSMAYPMSLLLAECGIINIVYSLFLPIFWRLSMIDYPLYTCTAYPTVSDGIFIQTRFGHCDPY